MKVVKQRKDGVVQRYSQTKWKAPFVVTIDAGIPYEDKANSVQELRKLLIHHKKNSEEFADENPYYDIWVNDANGKDITDDVFKTWKELSS